ncbi:gliding motility-associated C-terminal domain-containing protein [Cytophaga aurantiaca]|uniref:gliding motility-associated C-terminal domain-containing protein n=1 Tax=Cytophaga aurantiaca TaxID=29530 RepID=UPI00037CCD38|nr:T9SS C-terminal target domain-containing protein [Cytophaga aurantiaca]
MKRILLIITFLLFSCVESFSQCLNSGAAPTLKQTFGKGSPQFSTNTPAVEGFTTSYNQVFGGGSNTINDGQFAFINSVPNPFNVWHLGAKDHTGDPGGYMMMVNASFAPDEFYRQNISGLCVGVTYNFSVWLANVDLYNATRIKPNVRFEIRNSINNNLITFYETGDINNQNTFQWIQHSLTFTTTTSDITLLLLNNNPGGGGNDLALDDIEFKPCLPKYSINISNGIKKLCLGNDLLLNASVIGTDYLTPEYQWQHKNSAGIMIDIVGANSKTFTKNNIALADSGWYRLLISENGIANSIQCRSIDSIFIEIYPELKPGKIGSNQSICYNSKPAVLSSIALATGGNGSFTYSWEYSEDLTTWIDLNSATNSFTETQKLLRTRNYRRKVKTTCYEGYSDTVTVIVSPVVIPGKIGSNQTICYNSKPAVVSSNALATGGDGNYTYSWEYSEDLTTWIDLNTATSSFAETQKLLSTRNYRRKVISACYEGYSDTVTVIVLPAVLPGKIGSDQIVCDGDVPKELKEVAASSGGDGNYTYSWELSTDLNSWQLQSNSNTMNHLPVITINSDTWYRRKTQDGICSVVYSDTIKLTYQLTTIPTVTNFKFCKDIQTVPFSITGTNLLWYQDLSDVTGESTIPSPNTQHVGTFNYFVTQTVNTCESSKAEIQVEILSKPEIAVNSLAICEGEEGLLTASVLGGTGMLDYAWTPITGLSFVSNASAKVQPSITTDYQIIVTDSEFCKDTVVSTVTINPKPIVTIDGSDVCSGSPVTLNASVTNYTGVLHYDWSPTLGLSSLNTATVVATPLVTTDYKLQVIDSKNCKTEITKTVGVTTRPIAKIIGNDTILCTGESVEYQSYQDPLEHYSFVWYKSDDNINFYQVSTQPNYTTSERGYFRLNVYNNGICEAQSQIVHVKTEDISIKLDAQSSTIEWNDPINLSVVGGLSTYTYTWRPNPPIVPVNSPTVSFYNNQSAMYYVVVQGDKCFAEDSIFIKVLPPIKIPNVITPNGDNVNDAWEIAGLSEYTSAEVIIFNRWGTIVYNYPKGYIENWRGISKNGGDLPDGTYFYIINLKDSHNKSFNGYVEIIR